jgi:hypothetical protein
MKKERVFVEEKITKEKVEISLCRNKFKNWIFLKPSMKIKLDRQKVEQPFLKNNFRQRKLNSRLH